MKKIVTAFVLGLLLSVIPVTGLAASGSRVKLKNIAAVAEGAFNITRLAFGGCPKTIIVPYEIQQGDIIIEADVVCELTGESPDDGSGVSVCSYNCIAGGGGVS